MTRRPNVFNQEEFQAYLRRQDCLENSIPTVTGDFRLFVPLLIREVGEERFFEIVEHAREELNLGNQKPAWRESIKYIVHWAEEKISEYMAQQ